jgi:hypothetical protein
VLCIASCPSYKSRALLQSRHCPNILISSAPAVLIRICICMKCLTTDDPCLPGTCSFLDLDMVGLTSRAAAWTVMVLVYIRADLDAACAVVTERPSNYPFGGTSLCHTCHCQWRPRGFALQALGQSLHPCILIIIINPCKPYLTASAPRLTHWGGGK